MAFVAVYDKRTGRKHSVPEHWLDHPVLSRNFRKTPLTEAQQKKADDLLAAAATNDNAPAAGDGNQE